jgi:hypothetical protein
MYVVYIRIGALNLVLNTWDEYYDAYREAESLNKCDYKAYYFVRYKESFNGKNNDF